MDIEQEAGLQGWVPKEQFKGDEAKWVDAEAYVERGKHIMPILQNNNKRFAEKISELENTVANLKTTVSTAQESMEALKQFHQDSTKAQVEKARRDIIASLKAAKVDGDVEEEVQLTSDLSKFDAAQVLVQKEESKPKPKEEVAPPKQEYHPDTKAWLESNPWYGKDHVRTALMDGVAKQLRQEGNNASGLAFLMEAAKRAASIFGGEAEPEKTSKAESGRPTGGSASPLSKGYASLPADAKAICERQADKFVGANKVYKTMKEWQDFYTSEYHKGN